jgi:hypothetical protein
MSDAAKKITIFGALLIFGILGGIGIYSYFKGKKYNDAKNELIDQRPLSEGYTQNTKKNINTQLSELDLINFLKESKYKTGAKSYEYDFVDGEQPLTGLGPSYTQNYPSTLPSSNNMFVVPDLGVKYVNLLDKQI